MTSTYPTSLDTFAINKGDATDETSGSPTGGSAGDHAAHHNNLADAVNKIESTLGLNPLPWNIDIDIFLTPATQTNFSTLGKSDLALNNGYRQSTGVQNAEVGWDIVLGAGTWTFSTIIYTDADEGIYTVSLDGSTVGTIDGYHTGPATYNQLKEITGISVASSGKKRLLVKMATKNASSSNYYGSISALGLRRTA